MLKKIVFLVVILSLFKESSLLQSNPINETVIKIGKEEVSYGDLQRAFQKNMNRKNDLLFNVDKDSLKKFVELYANYKLKVVDSKDKGFDKDESVLNEFNSQRRLLAESFLYEKKILEPNIENILKRRERELMMSIIIIPFDKGVITENKSPIKEKATEALNKLKAGANFTDVCNEYSPDDELKKTGGFIKNYITSCDKIQRPIENALYDLKVGEIYPELIETSYGYMIVKLEKNEPRKYVKARHILIQKNNEEDIDRINKKADSLLALLKKGADFDKLAEINSDDTQSAVYGGYLGDKYSRATGMVGNGNRLVDEFVDALFLLKDGEISNKVNSEFGIHIIRRDSTFEIERNLELDDVTKKYKKLYYDEDKVNYIQKLMKDYGFVIDELNLIKLMNVLDTSKTNLDVSFTKLKENDVKNLIIVSNSVKKWSINDFVEFSLKNENRLRGTANNKMGLIRSINKMIEGNVLEIATKNLENEYTEFAKLSKDFYEGILLFKVENENVWEKLKFDTLIAQTYYDSTKTKYKTDLSYDVSEIYILNDSLAKDIYRKAINNVNFDELAATYTQRPGYREKNGKWGIISSQRSKFSTVFKGQNLKVGTITEPIQFETGYIVIKINDVIQPRQKTFEEAISDMSSDVQNIVRQNLLDNWLSKIKEKHELIIDWIKLDNVNGKLLKENSVLKNSNKSNKNKK